MKKISLEQLFQQSGEESYSEQYRYICSRIQANQLIPVKTSPLNGKKPALHQSYWIVEPVPDYEEEIEELKFRMAPEIQTDYYLRHLKVYQEEAGWVRLLNRYFLEQAEEKDRSSKPCFVSLNERSFQIWGREKFLQREQGQKVLAHCGVTLEQLHVYNTAEPLAYYSRIRTAPQTVLIVENKDTFYSMRRFLSGEEKTESSCVNTGSRKRGIPICAEGIRETEGEFLSEMPGRIFGVEIGTVVYGAGKGILRSFEDFSFCVEAHVNAPGNEILYFGDLDYEGIGIYEHLAALFSPGWTGSCCPGMVASGEHEIKPFVQAYEKMIEKARQCGLDFLPETSEKQNRSLSGLFFRYFSEAMKERMQQLLVTGKYIPQEIINRTDF